MPVFLVLMLLLAGCDPGEVAPEVVATTNEPAATLAFTDVTNEAGLGDFRHVNGAFGEKWFPETMGSGGGWIDYDGDGWSDLVLVGGGGWAESATRDVPALRLYRNQGDGTFVETTSEAGLDRLRGYGFGVAAADYDNDGDDDLFFTTLGPNYLLRNDSGRFANVSREAGFSDEKWSSAAMFFDADHDGHLDLFVGNYVAWTPETDLFCSTDGVTKGYCTPELYQGVPAQFYRNKGDGTFEDRTEEAGFSTTIGKTLGVAALDFNADGWIDLAVANDTDADLLYQNDGDGTFTELGVASGIAFDERGRARAGMGIDAGVVDTTGQETLFVGNFSNEMIGVYRHLGDGLFLDRAALSKIGRPSLLTLTFGLMLLDIDLDGDLDLFAANGHVQPDIERVKDNVGFRQPPHLFLNDGTGTFADAAPQIGGVLADSLVARGTAYADYDRDGDLDLLVTENDGSAHLWRNDLAEKRWLRVRLEGTASPRDGVGARVEAVVGGQRQVRRLRTGSSFLSQSEKVITFGLGAATQADSVIVHWPSGQVDRLATVPGSQTIIVAEGAGLKADALP